MSIYICMYVIHTFLRSMPSQDLVSYAFNNCIESQHQVEVLTKSLQRAQSEKASLRFENEELRKDNNALHTSNEKLQKDSDTLCIDNEELHKEMTALKDRVAKMEEDLKEKDAEVRIMYILAHT